MIASMFNLDHRLTELRPTADERRLARVREAAAPATGNPRRILALVRERLGAPAIVNRPSRIAAG
jgi:hypothetical protein